MKNFRKILLPVFIFLLFLNFNLFASEVQLAELRFQQELSLIQNKLRKDNEPFLLVHQEKTKVGFLLIHGFTGSSWDMKKLGQYLYDKGYNVYGVLLKGHGTKEDDLLKIKWEDWYQSVDDAYRLTKLIGDEVIVVGFSMGGNLVMHLAVNKPELKGIVSLASAIFFEDWKIVLSPIGKYFIKYSNRPLPPELKPYYYENRAVSAIHEVYKLSGVTKKELGHITQPILIIQSRSDKTINPKSAEYIYKNIGSKNKELVLLEDCPHALVTSENPKQNEVFEIIDNWAKKCIFNFL